MASKDIIRNEYLKNVDCDFLWRSDNYDRINGTVSQEFFSNIQTLYNDMTDYDIAYVA